MSIVVEVKGSKQLEEKILKYSKLLQSDEMKIYLANKMIECINREAKSKLGESKNYQSHNKYDIGKDYIRIFNDVSNDSGVPYSLILEYGSGIWSTGESFNHTKSYENSNGVYWLVPLEEGSSLARTGFEVVDIKLPDGSTGSFYKVYGQHPKYIYTDAVKTIERNISRWAKSFIDEIMGGK